MRRNRNGGDQITVHHRKPRSRRERYENLDTKANTVEVQRRYHEAFHLLFSNHSVQDIAKILNNTWIDPEFRLVVKPTGFKHEKK